MLINQFIDIASYIMRLLFSLKNPILIFLLLLKDSFLPPHETLILCWMQSFFMCCIRLNFYLFCSANVVISMICFLTKYVKWRFIIFKKCVQSLLKKCIYHIKCLNLLMFLLFSHDFLVTFGDNRIQYMLPILHPGIHLCCQSVVTSCVSFTHHSCSVCVCFLLFPLQFFSGRLWCQCLLWGSVAVRLEVNAVKVSQQDFMTLKITLVFLICVIPFFFQPKRLQILFFLGHLSLFVYPCCPQNLLSY